MRTLSLKIADSLDDELEGLAERRGQTKSALIREAISGYLSQNEQPREGSFLAFSEDLAGCVDGPEDLSTNKEYLSGFGR